MVLFITVLTLDVEYRLNLNDGVGEPSSFMGDSSVKTDEKESMKQLSTTPLQVHTWQRSCIEILRVKKVVNKHLVLETVTG